MHREGHIGLGLLLYAPIAFGLVYFDMMLAMALGMVCAVFFSYAPDFDLWLPYVSHRGATHTILGGVIASVCSTALAIILTLEGTLPFRPTLQTILGITGFTFSVSLVGFLSHLVGDVLTPMGIQPFQPWSNRHFTLELVYASDETANERLSYFGMIAITVGIVGGVVAQEEVLMNLL